VESESDPALLEWCVREELNKTALRKMAVVDPVKVVIDNWQGGARNAVLPNNPLDEAAGTREVPFGGEIWIDRSDFMEEPDKKFFRMAPGREVRLRGACIFKCNDLVKDAEGNVVEIHGTWDEESWGGNAADGRKVKGTIHWVDCATGKKAEFRLYDRLFIESNPLKDGSDGFLKYLNPDSLKVVSGFVEPSLAEANPLERFQFERTGYFVCDEKLVFNRTCSLKDSYKP
jgi:glutaminyl-tRNA synthetase